MKKYRQFANLIASAAVIASIAAVPMSASAAGTPYTPGLTDATDGVDPVSQNVTMIDKYLVMDVNANVPNASFDFSIAPYDSSSAEKTVITAASGTNLAVINGVTTQTSGTLDFKAADAANTGSAAAGVATFAQGDTTVTEGAAGADTAVVWQDATAGNEKYAKKTLTLDFSTVQFTEPGVYRYLITETGSNQGVTNDTGVTGEDQNTYRTLDVYVEDYADYYAKLADNSGYTAPNGKQLFIAGYVLYEGKHSDAPSATAATTTNKSSSYTNAYTSYDLTFS
ncbi:MAG: FctA domain-containing protein, partial [Acutalibacteraceae bacterium]|nr:FctA domain-containing protein [Acutalibacteraceae bacterium]